MGALSGRTIKVILLTGKILNLSPVGNKTLLELKEADFTYKLVISSQPKLFGNAEGNFSHTLEGQHHPPFFDQLSTVSF